MFQLLVDVYSIQVVSNYCLYYNAILLESFVDKLYPLISLLNSSCNIEVTTEINKHLQIIEFIFEKRMEILF